jgi:transposase
MEQVIIGVDPYKLSATIEVVDHHESLLGSGRFTTDQAGYAKTWPVRVWAVEGANGAGRPLAQRLLEAGEHVVDVPAKLAARVRLFDTGHNRKTDARDAHSIAIVAVRTKDLRVLRVDGELEALRILTDRREALTRRRVQTVERLQALLAELLPGQAKRDITTGQARSSGHHHRRPQESSGTNPTSLPTEWAVPRGGSVSIQTVRRQSATAHQDASGIFLPCEQARLQARIGTFGPIRVERDKAR